MLFYQALVLFAEGLGLWIVLGALARRRRARRASPTRSSSSASKLPIKPMLIAGASILLLLSVTFAGNAVRSLQEADVIGVTPIEGEWARLPVFVAELTGIHPTVEGIVVQARAARDPRRSARSGRSDRAGAPPPRRARRGRRPRRSSPSR